MPANTALVELLYMALDRPHGIVLDVSDVKRGQQQLYAARREAHEPLFERLSITPSRSHPTSQLWIVKNPEKP